MCELLASLASEVGQIFFDSFTNFLETSVSEYTTEAAQCFQLQFLYVNVNIVVRPVSNNII